MATKLEAAATAENKVRELESALETAENRANLWEKEFDEMHALKFEQQERAEQLEALLRKKNMPAR